MYAPNGAHGPRQTHAALTPYALSKTTKNVLNIYEMIMDQNLI
jgi:hypothetical protein